MQTLSDAIAHAYECFSPTTSGRVLALVVDPADIVVRRRLRALRLRAWQRDDVVEYLRHATLGEDTPGLLRVLPRLLEILAGELDAASRRPDELLPAIVDQLRLRDLQRWPSDDRLAVQRFFEAYLLAVMMQQPDRAAQLALDLSPVVGNIAWCLEALTDDEVDASLLLRFVASCSRVSFGSAPRPSNAPAQVLRRWLGARSTATHVERRCADRPELAGQPSYRDAWVCLTKAAER